MTLANLGTELLRVQGCNGVYYVSVAPQACVGGEPPCGCVKYHRRGVERSPTWAPSSYACRGGNGVYYVSVAPQACVGASRGSNGVYYVSVAPQASVGGEPPCRCVKCRRRGVERSPTWAPSCYASRGGNGVYYVNVAPQACVGGVPPCECVQGWQRRILRQRCTTSVLGWGATMWRAT